MDSFALNDFALGAVERSGDTNLLITLLEKRIELQPNNAQSRASLAFVHYSEGEVAKAIEVLQQGAQDIPSFSAAANCYIGNLEAGTQPDEGC